MKQNSIPSAVTEAQQRTDVKDTNVSQFFDKPLVVRSALSKYSPKFERDFNWYLSVRHKFNFDGSNDYTNNKGQQIVGYNKSGVSGKEAFYKWDSNGKILPTKHPNILHTLLKTKASVNLHIKMYAEDRAKGLLPLIEFSVAEAIRKYGLFNVLRFRIKTEGKQKVRELINNDFEHTFNLPRWFIDAVESQKFKYYDVPAS